MPYGKQAKEEMTKLVQGKCLKVLVHGEDRYGRCVGDVYCNNIFVQSTLSESHCHTLTQNFQVVDHGNDAEEGTCMALYSLRSSNGISKLGERSLSKADWSVGCIKPRRALGMEKESTGRQMMLLLEVTKQEESFPQGSAYERRQAEAGPGLIYDKQCIEQIMQDSILDW
ncbi:hypothetical protein Ancab_034548 [Ancistrocladus abbreviatus]